MVGMFVSLCLASKKSSEREFFVPARTHLGVKLLKLAWQAQPNHMVILVSWCLAQHSGTATAVQQYSSALQCSIAAQSSSAAVHNSSGWQERSNNASVVQQCSIVHTRACSAVQKLHCWSHTQNYTYLFLVCLLITLGVWYTAVNRLTAIRVLVRSKNSRPVGFLL